MARHSLLRRARRGRLLAAPGLAVLLAALIGYVALAATQHAGAWMFFAYDDRDSNSANGKHVDIAGSTNTLNGDIKSNGDFHAGGSGNVFNGTVRSHDNDGEPKVSDNTYNIGVPAQQ